MSGAVHRSCGSNLFLMTDSRVGFRALGAGYQDGMTHRGLRSVLALAGMVAGAVSVAACGQTSAAPSGVARAPLQPPGYVVAVPVPQAMTPPLVRPPQALADRVTNLVRAFGGKAGVGIRAVDEGWTIEAGGRQRLPQQSVSKLWVAITVLDQRDRGLVRMDDPIVVRTQDLTLFHQPIAALVKGDGYHTTVGELLRRALTMSDNTANDRLLSLVGGPMAVREMIAAKQLGDIRFGPGERLLQSYTAGLTWKQSMAMGRGFEAARAKLDPAVRRAAFERYVADPIDGAAPLAIADALARLARGELLSETSTRLLLDTMAASHTGRARLKAVLPASWEMAHKTGTGQELGSRNAGLNDVGLLTAPDGRRYAIAVMIGDTTHTMRERQQFIQAVGAALIGGHALSPAMAATADDEEAGS
jgi:beta-lactamase class A